MIQRPKRFGFWRKWLRRPWDLIANRHNCLKCGFLAFDSENETSQGARSTIAAEGEAGWFVKEDQIDCYRRLWFWDSGEAPISIIIFEANRPRFSCSGFQKYSPRRSPKEHLRLEDESREFRRRKVLGLIAFLGALLGALIGAFLGRKH